MTFKKGIRENFINIVTKIDSDLSGHGSLKINRGILSELIVLILWSPDLIIT